MIKPIDAMHARLKADGLRASVVKIQRLAELMNGIQNLRANNLLDEQFYEERLSGFEFAPTASGLEAHSLIVVAIPQPQYRFSFETGSGVKDLVIPPTYLFEEKIDEEVKEKLIAILSPFGYKVNNAFVPKKLLAVRSGLGVYGRNNICYVESMGSFFRLAAFYSNLPCPEDDWQESRMMPECRNCTACLKQCPSGAIAGDRFLLHAERCLTYHNEKAGDVPFAEWLQPSWHANLVGCMRCQSICPQNKAVKDWVVEGVSFSIEETEFLLDGTPFEQLPETMQDKIEAYDLFDLLDGMPRNLSACGVKI
jgi:epoxyqueuosine reductase